MKVYFKSRDGIRLVGILEKPRQKTDACVILCHGATVDKEEVGVFTYLAKRLARAGYATFRFDFRGHGESGGRPVDMTVKGETIDLESAYGFLIAKNYKRFGIVAASFGGGAASYFTPSHQDRVRTVIWWNSALDYSSLRKRWLSMEGRRTLKKYGYIDRGRIRYGRRLAAELLRLKPWKELGRIRVPMLFLHGDRDSHIPIDEPIRFSKATGSGLKVIRGSEHGFHTKKDREAAADAAVGFLRKNLPR